MKNLPQRLLTLSAALVIGGVLTSAHAQTDVRNVILVIRHGEDADDWGAPGDSQPAGKTPTHPWLSKAWGGESGVCPTWPKYLHPYALVGHDGTLIDSNPDGLQVPLHGLSGLWETWGKYDNKHKDGTRMTMKKRDANGNVVKDANGETVKVPRTVPYTNPPNGDAPYGEDQAIKLAEKLDAFLEKNRYAPVRKAITSNPQTDPEVNPQKYGEATPNPFDTIWPYLSKRQTAGTPADLVLVKRKGGDDKSPGLMAMVDGKEGAQPLLDDAGGSTLIAWTGEGMEGSDGLLARLSNKFRPGKSTDWVGAAPSRCADIYIFYTDPADNEGVGEHWLFDANTGEFTWKATKPEKKAPGQQPGPADDTGNTGNTGGA